MIYNNYHAPDQVRVFNIPKQSIRLWNEKILVYDLKCGELILRHYSFYDKWLEINCTLDLKSNFVTEKGPIEWCFNCDICTPLFSIKNNFYNVDLFIDVLVGSDGKEHIVKDQDAFNHAIAKEWIANEEIKGAKRGLEKLLEIINRKELIIFLDRLYPFKKIDECGKSSPYRIEKLKEFPYLTKEIRLKYFGKKL